MANFMSGNTAMTIFKFIKPGSLDIDKLRQGAFSGVIDADGFKSGWTGMGNLLDTDNFFLAFGENGFSGFSWRFDARKPSQAVARLQLAEKIRAEEAAGKKVGRARKKELKEAILASLTSQAEFVPSLTDCIWDSAKGRLFVSSISPQVLERILKHFCGTFNMTGNLLEPGKEMSQVFSRIQNDNGIKAANMFIQPLGSAYLKNNDANSEKSAVAVQNNTDAVDKALKQGMEITRLGLIATMEDQEDLVFTLDSDLKVTRLALPKADKDAEEEATFLINAQICSKVADIVEDISK